MNGSNYFNNGHIFLGKMFLLSLLIKISPRLNILTLSSLKDNLWDLFSEQLKKFRYEKSINRYNDWYYCFFTRPKFLYRS